MEFLFLLAALGSPLFMLLAAVGLIWYWKQPGPRDLQRDEIQELREQISIMRDFMRDAMDRIRRLEGRVELDRPQGPDQGRLPGDAPRPTPSARPGTRAPKPGDDAPPPS